MLLATVKPTENGDTDNDWFETLVVSNTDVVIGRCGFVAVSEQSIMQCKVPQVW